MPRVHEPTVASIFKKLSFAEEGSNVDFTYTRNDNFCTEYHLCEVIRKRAVRGRRIFSIKYDFELEDQYGDTIYVKTVSYSSGTTLEIILPNKGVISRQFPSLVGKKKKETLTDFQVYTRPEIRLELFSKLHRAIRMVQRHYKRIFNIDDSQVGVYNVVYNIVGRFKGEEALEYFKSYKRGNIDFPEIIKKLNHIKKTLEPRLLRIDDEDERSFESMKRFLELDDVVGLLMWKQLEYSEKRRYRYLDMYLKKYENHPLYICEYKKFFKYSPFELSS
jgi:hypothetical protein